MLAFPTFLRGYMGILGGTADELNWLLREPRCLVVAALLTWPARFHMLFWSPSARCAAQHPTAGLDP